MIVRQYVASSSPYNQSTSSIFTSEYSQVFSSGRNRQHFAPASIAILEIVILEATDMASTAEPVISSALYVAPSARKSPIKRKITSFAVTFAGNVPLITTLIVSGTRIHISPVPSIEAISV